MEKQYDLILLELTEKYPLFVFSKRGSFIEVQISSSNKRIFKSIQELSGHDSHKELDDLHFQKKRSLELAEEYPNLYVSKHGVWVIRGKDSKEREKLAFFAASTKEPIDLYNPDHALLAKLNKSAQRSVDDPRNWFFCSGCNSSIERKNYVGQVFSAHYCKDCVDQDPEKAEIIKEANKTGFYS